MAVYTQGAPRADQGPVAQIVPRPRRFTVVLGLLASVGVAATSFSHADPALLFPLTLAWLAPFALGAFWLRGGPILLTGLAGAVKLITLGLIGWTLTHPNSSIGPHQALDWIPLGSLNAATGIWLLRLIRHQAR